MWVKLKKHTVKSVSGNKALLKEINGWNCRRPYCLLIVCKDRRCPAARSKIKPGATYGGLTAARGSMVPNTQLTRTHTVGKIQVNGGVREALTDI